MLLALCVCGVSAAKAESTACQHETLMQWSKAFCKYEKKFARAFGQSGTAELPQPDGLLLLDEAAQRMHGEVWNESGTAAVLLDASAEDPSYWRAALMYSADAQDGTILAGSYALMMAAIQVGFAYSTDLHSVGELLDAVFALESVSAQKDGYVLIHQEMEDGSQWLAVESIGWFDTFDFDTIEKMYQLE